MKKRGGRVTQSKFGEQAKSGSRHIRRKIEKMKSKLEAKGYTFPK